MLFWHIVCLFVCLFVLLACLVMKLRVVYLAVICVVSQQDEFFHRTFSDHIGQLLKRLKNSPCSALNQHGFYSMGLLNLLWVLGCGSVTPSKENATKNGQVCSHLTAIGIPRCSFDSPGWCLVLGAKNCIPNPQASPWGWHGLQLSRDSWVHLRYTKDISLALSGTDDVLPHTRRVVYLFHVLEVDKMRWRRSCFDSRQINVFFWWNLLQHA